MIRIVFFFFCLVLFDVNSSFGQASKVLNQNISITFQQDSLPSALAKLQNVIQGDFAFDPAIIPHGKYITKNFVSISVARVLEQLLSGTGLSYTTVGKAVVIIKK